ncbi:MAG TPA: glycosyltransferase family 9 protein, partial [Planctomycetota bacterium]|nr:glycosyltransferase family 9 protein [Planctomycetota bacterium]
IADRRTTSTRGEAPRVLVVRLSAIGDVLHALPAVAALRKARPGAYLAWAVEDRAAALLEGHPALDRVLVLPRRRWSRAARRMTGWPAVASGAGRWIRDLIGERFDVALDLQGNLKSGLVAWASGAPARYGFSSDAAREGNGFFVNRRVPALRGARHKVDRNVALVEACLGERTAPLPADLPRDPADVAWTDAALLAAGLPSRGFVVLHPGTSGFGAFKRWPAERFARLATRIRRDAGVPVAITFGPGEEPLAEEVRTRAAAVALATPSLRALAEVLRRAAAFVSGDTGPLHVAAAVGTPVLGLFGPKDADVYGPWGRRPDGTSGPLPVLTRADVPCRPCTLRWCPEPVCMSAIEEDDVLAALLAQVLRRGA